MRKMPGSEIHHLHERKGRDDRGGDGHAGDDRAAPVVQKKEDRDGHEDGAEEEMEADRQLHRLFCNKFLSYQEIET